MKNLFCTLRYRRRRAKIGKGVSVALLSAVLLTAYSCKVPTDAEVPSWDADLVGPVFYSNSNINSLKELDKLTYPRTIKPDSLFGSTGIIGNINRDSVPYRFLVFDTLQSIDLIKSFAVKAKAVVSIKNSFPDVGLARGLTIKYWTGSNQFIGSVTLNAAIDKGGAFPQFKEVGSFMIENKEVSNPIYMTLHNVQTSGGTVSQLEGLEIKTAFYRDSLENIKARPNSLFSLNELNSFSLEEFNGSDVKGGFILRTRNEFPVRFKIQGYFVTDTITLKIVDSLFTRTDTHLPFGNNFALIDSAVTNTETGAVITPFERRDTISLSPARIERLNKARYIKLVGTSLQKNFDIMVSKDSDLMLRLGFDGTLTVNKPKTN